MSTKPIVVIGATGQVAQALRCAASGRGIHLVCAGRPETDINDLASLSAVFDKFRPALVVNAAAYTAVDKAEEDVEAARNANHDGPARLAVLCDTTGAALVHLSTDYVFDGKASSPYREEQPAAPLNVYGLTKAAGEEAVRSVLARHVILRTAWVYGPTGQNFLKTMLRLGSERDVVRVIADQKGTPTSASDIASAILDIAPRLIAAGACENIWGTYHLTAQGETTWHGFAAEIFRLAGESGRKVPRLEAITAQEYPLPAVRPSYSVLDTRKIRAAFGVALPDWQKSVSACFKRLPH